MAKPRMAYQPRPTGVKGVKFSVIPRSAVFSNSVNPGSLSQESIMLIKFFAKDNNQ